MSRSESRRGGRPRIAITCGDPAGIGPEVIEGWLRQTGHAAAGTTIIGPQSWLAGLQQNLQILFIPAKGSSVAPARGSSIVPPGESRTAAAAYSGGRAVEGAVLGLAVGMEDYVASPGRPDGESSLVAWAALERAAQGCIAGEFDAVVTGPVSKERLAGIGWDFPGQTEFFAARWGGEPVMAFAGGKLRVVLLTWHVPLARVPQLLTRERFERAIAAADALSRVERMAADAIPRIGVCGLNPHAGENGLLGREELDLINPILDGLRGRYPKLSTAQPGDTLFARHARGEFDVVVALYHDQGLAPLKLVDFDQAVNLTLGLPHVRTSPDHGTAYSLAGKGEASHASFANAVHWAEVLVKRRNLLS
jgi:4-hydroxythreonine-4-phosphate dehydrogenase